MTLALITCAPAGFALSRGHIIIDAIMVFRRAFREVIFVHVFACVSFRFHILAYTRNGGDMWPGVKS